MIRITEVKDGANNTFPLRADVKRKCHGFEEKKSKNATIISDRGGYWGASASKLCYHGD